MSTRSSPGLVDLERQLLKAMLKVLNSVGGDALLVKHQDSAIMLPVDVQGRFKSPPLTLYSGTVTGNGNTSDIDVTQYSSLRVMVKVTNVGGTSPSLNVYLEGKFEATGDYVPLLSRTGITSTGVYELGQVDNLCFRYVRVRWEVSGTSPSFTFGVYGQAMV